MRIIQDINELKNYTKTLENSVGFVPTMGALHAGHLSLIKQSVSQNEHSIVSIFVNPTQFLQNEDLSKYPRRLEADFDICSRAGVSAVFAPNETQMYFDTEALITAPPQKSYILEGEFRPGHFDGVLRVVLKLFNLINPTRAYFGKKDAQQLYLVQNMVKSLFLNTQIIPCEIVREHDGLALSSRNVYLNDTQRKEALKLSLSLKKASEMILQNKLTCEDIKEKMAEVLSPLDVNYIQIVNKDFEKISQIELKNSIILVAANLGFTRLIDNMWV